MAQVGSITDVAALMPGAERFDSTGGAIASWVRETYSRSKHSTLVASPRATESFAAPVPIANVRLYDAYERVLSSTSRLLAPRIGKSFQVVYNRLLWDRLWVRSAYRRIREAKLIHIHNRPHYARELREAGFTGAVILHMHNDLRTYVTMDESAEVFSHIDYVAFCSDFVRDRAVESFPALPPSAVVANGVSRSQIDRRVERQPSATLRLIYAGRIIPEKGPLEAVAICGELRRRGIKANLDLVGGTGTGSENGPTQYLSQVEAAVSALNRREGDTVARFLGPRPHDEVFDLFAANDIFLLPCSWEEPFGMVALEAMAKGCVPVVSDRGGLPDVVQDGGVAVRIPEDQREVPVVFADAIERVNTPDDLTRLRACGWNRAEQLTWESVATSFDDLIEIALRAVS
ncbi:MAG TPA: glycosyltransferase family 4 protein [Microbacterium sp.]|nr:glycosyltransferase family 4 protein [Microbacterium sp.]